MEMNVVRKWVGGGVGGYRGGTSSRVVYCYLPILILAMGCQLKTRRAC
jgi:hypothetical protein